MALPVSREEAGGAVAAHLQPRWGQARQAGGDTWAGGARQEGGEASEQAMLHCFCLRLRRKAQSRGAACT